jgi:hypothetical protein
MLVAGFKARYRIIISGAVFFKRDEDIFVIKRTAIQLLSEFHGWQMIRFVSVDFEATRKRCETDAYYGFYMTALICS